MRPAPIALHMKPFQVPPLAFIIIVNQFLVANVMNSIGLTMHATARFGAEDFAVGMLGTVQFTTYAALVWRGGLLSDRFPKRALMAVGLFALSALLSMVPYANSMPVLYLLAACTSAVQVIVIPADFGLIGQVANPARVSKLLGIAGFTFVFAGMIAAKLVGPLYENYGAKITFHSAAAVSFVIATFICFFAPRPHADSELGRTPASEEAAADRDAPAALTVEIPGAPASGLHRFLYAALALNFLGFFVGFGHQTLLVRIATIPELSMSFSEQSEVQSYRMMGAMLGYAIGATWSGWQWKRWPFWVIGFWILAVTMGAAFAPNTTVFTIAIGLGGIATALGNQLSLYYCVGAGMLSRGRGAGANEIALGGGAAIGTLAGGLAAQVAGTPRAALFVPLVPIIVAMCVWGYVFRRRQPE